MESEKLEVRFRKAKRRHQVCKLYLQGKRMYEIAEALDVSGSTVKKDLEWMMEQWSKEDKLSFTQQKQREVERINATEAAAWQGWERSLNPTTTNHTKLESMTGRLSSDEVNTSRRRRKKEGDLLPVKTVNETKTVSSSGDPRFLETIIRCVMLRMKVLGLYEEKHETNVYVNWAELYEQETRRHDPIEAEILKVSGKALPDPTQREGIMVESDLLEKQQLLEAASTPLNTPDVVKMPEAVPTSWQQVLEQLGEKDNEQERPD